MDVAQIYMLALRPTMVPIAGESWAAMPFYGQVELEGWSWDLYNAEEKVKSDRARSDYQEKSSKFEEQNSKALNDRFKALREKMEAGFDSGKANKLEADAQRLDESLRKRLDAGERLSKEAYASVDALRARAAELRKETVAQMDDAKSALKQTEDAYDDSVKQERKDREKELSEQEAIERLQAKNFEFTFRKRVDISTTQLLNCLKAGDKLPTVTLTMHQSSSNTPWILVFTLTGVRLKDYKVRVETSDTMTDMKEEWSAEFEQFNYVYQNRPHAGVKSITAGHANTVAARAATQATVRTFVMMPRRVSSPF